MYDGRTPLEKGTVVGHEIMGVIEEVGEAVESIKKGDRVVLPFNVSCGYCFNCHRGHTEACLVMNPEQPHAATVTREWVRTKAAKPNLFWFPTPISTVSSCPENPAPSGKMIFCSSRMYSQRLTMPPSWPV
jgi:threonine dehydrogenase-like Zn-dependent dehydrogenase